MKICTLLILNTVATFTLLASASSVFAASTEQVLLSDVLAGKGELVFLKPVTISGKFSDGTPSTVQEIIYPAQNGATGSAASPLICSAIYSTSDLSLSTAELTSGKDAVFAAGDSFPYLTDSLEETRYETATVDGNTHETISLTFSSIDGKLLSMDCNGSSSMPLTVADFEAATQGSMTLRSTSGK